jgi:hypothetical protein
MMLETQQCDEDHHHHHHLWVTCRKTYEGLYEARALYGWYVVKNFIFFPAHVVFSSFFAPSRYESQLWDLKKCLARLVVESGSEVERQQHLRTSLARFINYETQMSKNFSDVIGVMLTKDREEVSSSSSSSRFRFFRRKPTNKVNLLPHKYLHLLRAAVDWEIVRISPWRCAWTTSDQLTTLCGGLFLVSPFVFYKTKKSGDASSMLPQPQAWKAKMIFSSHAAKRALRIFILLQVIHFFTLASNYLPPDEPSWFADADAVLGMPN